MSLRIKLVEFSLILAFSSSQAEPRRRPYPLNQRDNCQSHLFLMALNNLFMAFPLLAEPFPSYLVIPNSDSYDAPAEANMRPWIGSKTTLMILTLVAPMLISRPADSYAGILARARFSP